MTADPRIVPNARSLKQLSYEEVAELAYYGAKVLHPKTVTPAIEKKIPVRVLNTFEPSHPGTLIVEKSQAEAKGTVKAITAIRNMNLITIAGRGMMGVPGIAACTFGAVARVGANVLMISQSRTSTSSPSSAAACAAHRVWLRASSPRSRRQASMSSPSRKDRAKPTSAWS